MNQTHDGQLVFDDRFDPHAKAATLVQRERVDQPCGDAAGREIDHLRGLGASAVRVEEFLGHLPEGFLETIPVEDLELGVGPGRNRPRKGQKDN